MGPQKSVCIKSKIPLDLLSLLEKGPLDILSKSTTSANAIMLDMYCWKACHHLREGLYDVNGQVSYAIARSR